MAIPDRRPREVGKGRGEASLTGRAARPVENNRELKHTAREPISRPGRWADAMRLVHPPTPASGWRVTTIPMRVLVTICNFK